MVLTPLRDLFADLLPGNRPVGDGKLVSILPVALALAAVTAATKVATGMFAARREEWHGVGSCVLAPRSLPGEVFFDHHRAGRCLGQGFAALAGSMCSSWRSSVRYWPATPAVGPPAAAASFRTQGVGPAITRCTGRLSAIGFRYRRAVVPRRTSIAWIGPRDCRCRRPRQVSQCRVPAGIHAAGTWPRLVGVGRRALTAAIDGPGASRTLAHRGGR